MHFIIETDEQLDKLEIGEECFIQVITNHPKYHPKISSVSLVYYHDFNKGYMICINHSESLSINFTKVLDFIAKHDKVYVFDKKWHSYFINHSNLIDIHYNQMALGEEAKVFDFDTTAHRCIEQSNREFIHLNEIIPISKHYEKWEKIRLESVKYMKPNKNIIDLSQIYKSVEESGIRVDTKKLIEVYSIQNPDYFIRQDIAFNQYNLYNQTGRPTNSFNGINFLAIPKDKIYRDCFLPRNDYLVEFDFDAYHPRLIAKQLDIELSASPFHDHMAKLYFAKDEISEQEYSLSKEYTFRQLYGGVMKEWKNIEFFSKMEKYIEDLWDEYLENSEITLPTGIIIRRQKGMNKYKIFNYFIQNLETKNNYEKISEILHILDSKVSRLVLITYDSFLIDYSISDGKELLQTIKNILSKNNMLVKHKYAKTYYF